MAHCPPRGPRFGLGRPGAETMMTAPTLAVRALQHDSLDALCWRHLGRTAGAVEATLDANPGLARLAADLPAGHLVHLVAPPAAARPLIQLWD